MMHSCVRIPYTNRPPNHCSGVSSTFLLLNDQYKAIAIVTILAAHSLLHCRSLVVQMKLRSAHSSGPYLYVADPMLVEFLYYLGQNHHSHKNWKISFNYVWMMCINSY